jgi:hypothetical protein
VRIRSWLPALFWIAVAVPCTGCTTRVLQEQVYPPEAWGSGQSGKALRVRVVGNASDATLCCLARSHAISDAVATMVNNRTGRDLQNLNATVPVQVQSAQSAGQDLDQCVQALRLAGPAASEADLLRVMNAVALGLGAPAPFTTVAAARAWLAQAQTQAP